MMDMPRQASSNRLVHAYTLKPSPHQMDAVNACPKTTSNAAASKRSVVYPRRARDNLGAYRTPVASAHDKGFVAFAGSSYTFAITILLIVAWAVAGAWLATNALWQITIQNVSSVQCYLWDITLLFAQRRDNIELAKQISHLQASGELKLAKLRQLQSGEIHLGKHSPSSTVVQVEADGDDPQIGYKALPQKSWYDATADLISTAAGSPWMQLIYAGGIAAWLAMGPPLQFDNDWQLDINTAVAVELMLMTTFLQNTKRRHRLYMHACARKLGDLDAELEEQLLGEATVDEVDSDFELIKPAKRQPGVCGWLRANFGPHVCVDRYALFMGSIGGLTLSVLLLGVWVGLGAPMGYDNPNWLLIIGTYSGLVGFVDAFVLRNVMKRQTVALLACCNSLDKQDAKIAELLGTKHISPPAPDQASRGIFYRISFFFSRVAGHIAVTFASVGVVATLLIIATVMQWTTTAQLLCNTPTMIVEGGMLLVLMMAHMASHQYMRARLQTLLQRRLAFQAALDRMAAQLPNLVANRKHLDIEKILTTSGCKADK
ncbi:g4644 [Coccomyxa viridis]|uniref:G4644 protein n=1 Tax=Coccomyxa viridis TaxID=1274662 RepID=A0ABP1FXQ0_9CHLO